MMELRSTNDVQKVTKFCLVLFFQYHEKNCLKLLFKGDFRFLHYRPSSGSDVNFFLGRSIEIIFIISLLQEHLFVDTTIQ